MNKMNNVAGNFVNPEEENKMNKGKVKMIDEKREKPYYNSENRTIFLKLDSYMLSKKNNESTEDVYNYIFDRIKVKIQSLLENDCNVIIDGLFLNNEEYIHIAKTFKDYDIILLR